MMSAAIGRRSTAGRWTCAPGSSSPCCSAAALLALIALTRTGIRTFWSGVQREPPRVRAAEGCPWWRCSGLRGLLTVAAGPTMAFARAAARSLHDRQDYIDAVLGARGDGARPRGREAPRR